jgi:hypothetical protein
MIPLLRAGLAFGAALRLALAADTVSIAIMEIVDNVIMIFIPGAMLFRSTGGSSHEARAMP